MRLRDTDVIVRSEEFGLSNYMAWEVAEVVGICKRRGFVLPTVYQGVYNLVYRVPEAEYAIFINHPHCRTDLY